MWGLVFVVLLAGPQGNRLTFELPYLTQYTCAQGAALFDRDAALSIVMTRMNKGRVAAKKRVAESSAVECVEHVVTEPDRYCSMSSACSDRLTVM